MHLKDHKATAVNWHFSVKIIIVYEVSTWVENIQALDDLEVILM